MHQQDDLVHLLRDARESDVDRRGLELVGRLAERGPHREVESVGDLAFRHGERSLAELSARLERRGRIAELRMLGEKLLGRQQEERLVHLLIFNKAEISY